jgi:glutaredoxin
MGYELVMYSRLAPCPYVRTAKQVLERLCVPYREVFIDQDEQAGRRVLDWTGYQSVPTLVVVRPGENLPYEEPAPIPSGTSPRGVDRGTIITEPGELQLENWLRKHGFIESC